MCFCLLLMLVAGCHVCVNCPQQVTPGGCEYFKILVVSRGCVC